MSQGVRWWPLLCTVVAGLALHGQVMAATLEDQRSEYRQAKKALASGKITEFLALAGNLRGYPLYPYLRYNYLKPRLHKVNAEEIREFLREFGDFPLAEHLRTEWLKHLARTTQWQAFSDNYAPQEDVVLQCYHLLARLNTHNTAYLLEDTRSLWLAGKSQPPQCDPAFDLLYKSGLMTNELLWQRIRLAMENGNTGLANHLGRRLDDYYRPWLARWVAIHGNPDKGTLDPGFDDTPIAREILIHGLKRLARQNLNRAVERWDKLRAQYDFTPQELSETNRYLAVRAAKARHPRLVELLDSVENFYVDDEVFHWRLRTALENYSWRKLLDWTSGVASIDDIRLRWIYWHGRARELIGDREGAEQVFATISGERDYYGFLAADRIGVDYNLNHRPLPENPAEKSRIAGLPGIERAKELRALGEHGQARREWQHALRSMTRYQMEIAAAIATEWGWYDRAIMTLGTAHAYDDLKLRFPIPYQDIIDQYVEKRRLDPGWVYALVRSESAFMEDARSPAGALGLMQVMPQTGRITARSLGMKKFHPDDLLKADKNVPIGSAYLRQMYDLFNGNPVLATAAYNAGPHRVKSWLPKSGCMEPDIWVEKIPFAETWKYVRRVLFYASIYDWRLERDIVPVHRRMATIESPRKTLVAGLSCQPQEVSYN